MWFLAEFFLDFLQFVLVLLFILQEIIIIILDFEIFLPVFRSWLFLLLLFLAPIRDFLLFFSFTQLLVVDLRTSLIFHEVISSFLLDLLLLNHRLCQKFLDTFKPVIVLPQSAMNFFLKGFGYISQRVLMILGLGRLWLLLLLIEGLVTRVHYLHISHVYITFYEG